MDDSNVDEELESTTKCLKTMMTIQLLTLQLLIVWSLNLQLLRIVQHKCEVVILLLLSYRQLTRNKN